MEAVLHHSIESFVSAVEAHLEQAEAENSLLLGTLSASKRASQLPFMAEVRFRGRPVAASFYLDRNLIISRGLKAGWRRVAAKLQESGIDIPGVVGPASDAEHMARAWSEARGCDLVLGVNQRIYKLTAIKPTPRVVGSARLMTAEDTEIIARFLFGFYSETLPIEMPTREQILKNAKARVQQNSTFVWETGGQVVAMAALARPTKRGVSVNGVYTSSEHRCRGYGTALVASVSREGLRRGHDFCVLYTDLLNPTSNSIYQKIGYKPVCDSKNYRFIY